MTTRDSKIPPKDPSVAFGGHDRSLGAPSRGVIGSFWHQCVLGTIEARHVLTQQISEIRRRRQGVADPISPWGHGLRIWLATSVALYAAFWLQLESPVSAGLTVAILAQPRRGHALSRSMYRFGGTAAGGVAAIILVAVFGQEPILLLSAFTALLGVCVFVAAYLAGDRAYGAVLCGYTVAMIVIANISQPQNVFMLTVERVSAITVGIAAVTLVNIGFGSPSVWTGLQTGILGVADATRDFVRGALRDGPPEAANVAGLLVTVVALRDDARLIAWETTDGANRAAGARSAIAALSAMIASGRSLAAPAHPDTAGPVRSQCLAVIEDRGEGGGAPLRWQLTAATLDEKSTPAEVCILQQGADLVSAHDQLHDGLEALGTGARPKWQAGLPIHRDLPVALRDASRIMIAVGIGAMAFMVSGWPATSAALSLVATLCALSAIAPSQAGFATAALISLPIAVVASGIIRFLFLDGSQGFLILILAMAPATYFACNLMLRKKTAGIGLLLNVFMMTLLSPSNVESYDLQSFLNTAVLAGLSVVVLFLTSRLVLPVSAQQRLQWALRSSRQNLADMIAGRRRPAEAQRARSDDQLAQYATWSAGTGRSLPNMLVMADLAVAVAGANSAMRQTADDESRRHARKALFFADTEALDAVAQTLLDDIPSADEARRPGLTRAVAEMSTIAAVIRARRTWPVAKEPREMDGVDAVVEQIRIRSGLAFRVARYAATTLLLVCAATGSLAIWNVYVTSPWTRDGQVRVQVVRVAPRVSGEITSVAVADNQFVHKGDLLYIIDPFDYAIALASAVAEADSREADLTDKENQNERRRALSTLSTSVEEKQQFDAAFKMATSAVANARAQRAQAQTNLYRTEIRSPVNGYVTNLLMRPGDYATAGSINISIIDSDSYWVDGYFEETKLARIQVGDSASVQLMGYAEPLHGVVESVTRGISSAQAASNTQGLPDIDPVYTWVRLAQRIPVRIRIFGVPPNVPLVAGMTCTVSVIEPPEQTGGLLHDLWRRL